MADKKYPVLYATSIKGTIFRHCGVYNTIYFNIYNNISIHCIRFLNTQNSIINSNVW